MEWNWKGWGGRNISSNSSFLSSKYKHSSDNDDQTLWIYLWKKSFLKNKYCCMLILTPEAHDFNWTYSLFQRQLEKSIRLFLWCLPFSMSLQCWLITSNWRLDRSSSSGQLNWFWIMETFFTLASVSEKNAAGTVVWGWKIYSSKFMWQWRSHFDRMRTV